MSKIIKMKSNKVGKKMNKSKYPSREEAKLMLGRGKFEESSKGGDVK